MRRYETIVIIDPDLSEEARDPLFEKIKDLISRQEGFLIVSDEWGTQKLAYEIRKKVRGHYVRLDYCGTGALVSELERSFRIDDRVLKYMTVLLEKDVDVESFKQKEEPEAPEVTDEPSADKETAASDAPDEGASPEASDDVEPEAAEDELTQKEE